jgi:3D (Asp-Asp-Asp) domain-containing protein
LTTALFIAFVLFLARPLAAEPNHLQNPSRQKNRELPAAQTVMTAPQLPDALPIIHQTASENVQVGDVAEEPPVMPFLKAKAETSVPSLTAQKYLATAYSLRGRTATGGAVRKGIIAADPRVLPLGTRVRLEAGAYSGEYLVADTGGSVRGRKIDVWVPTTNEACRFGRRSIKLTVLSYGKNRR